MFSRLTEVRPLLNGAVCLADVWWARWRRRRPRTLSTLLLFITYQCNLRCAMCGVRHQPVQKELSLEQYRELLDAARRLRCSLMLISGGEALTRGSLVYEIIRLGRERGIAAHLCSNGLLIDADVARRLQESGLRSLNISLDGHQPEVHDAIRGAGAFNQAVAAIQTVRAQAPDIRIGINCTLTALNYRHLAVWPSFAESLGAHQLKFAPFHTNLLHAAKPDAEFNPLLFSRDQLTELEDELVQLRQALRHSHLLANHPRYLKHLADAFAQAPSVSCYAGYAACTIDPFGKVSPCPDLAAGLSLHEQPLDLIWRGDAFQLLREQVCSCSQRCWDPLYTELSLRLSPTGLVQGLWQLWQDRHFYLDASTRQSPPNP